MDVKAAPEPMKMTSKTKDGRLKFEYEGRTVYEWEQSLDEVNIYIRPPAEIPKKFFDIKITHKHLKVGIKDANPFIDEDTGGPIIVDESMWTLSDGELTISLQKMNRAEAWTRALIGRAGNEIDPVTKEEQRKKLMLERFQEEHPGFDFSGAEFNGAIPEARDFMGGIGR